MSTTLLFIRLLRERVRVCLNLTVSKSVFNWSSPGQNNFALELLRFITRNDHLEGDIIMTTASKPTIVRRLVMWNMVTLDDLPETCGWKKKEMAGRTLPLR